MPETEYEAVIGLEVHVQLLTETKIFCRCRNRFGAPPNTLVCPVCLGYPGTLPTLNREAVELAVKLAAALGCTIHRESLFARKNYFYADLPKGYQISQFDRPLSEDGELRLSSHDREVRIRRLHIEEDAGKLLHELPGGGFLPDASLVDFNRCGVPLVEIVSEPDMRSPQEAQDYLQTLHQVLLYTETSDGNMEEGSLRCDANVSVRPRGSEAFGTKTEVKNLNSFRNVARALSYEIDRQSRLLDAGTLVAHETLSFDAGAGETRVMRSKEEAHDYRYFPEPDLPPLVVEEERVERIRAALPELPARRRERFVAEYGLSPEDAEVLTSVRQLAEYFEAAAAAHEDNVRGVANWVRTEVLAELRERGESIDEALDPARLAALVRSVDEGVLSQNAAKEVLSEIWETGEEPGAAAERLGLTQVRDEEQIEEWIEEVLDEHPDQVEAYRNGKSQLLGFFIGQVMQRSDGRADPKIVRGELASALGSPGEE